MGITVEQTVDAILKPPMRQHVLEPHRKTLEDIRSKTWWPGRPITQKQQNLVYKLVSNYLLLLKQHKWPVDDLLNPVWSCEVVQSASKHQWEITFDEQTEMFAVRFPYLEQLVKTVRSIADSPVMMDSVSWSGKDNAWLMQDGIQSRQLLRYLLTQSPYWIVEHNVRQRIFEESAQVPVIRYINGEWSVVNACPTLRDRVEQIAQQELGMVKTMYELSTLQTQFDHTVRNSLRSWLTPQQIELLCEPYPIIQQDCLHELAALIEQVDLWPVAFVQSPSSRSLSCKLPFTTHVETSCYNQADIGSRDSLTRILSRPGKQEIRFAPYAIVPWVNKLEVKVPWLIQQMSLSALYSFQSELYSREHFYQSNFRKHIMVIE